MYRLLELNFEKGATKALKGVGKVTMAQNTTTKPHVNEYRTEDLLECNH